MARGCCVVAWGVGAAVEHLLGFSLVALLLTFFPLELWLMSISLHVGLYWILSGKLL